MLHANWRLSVILMGLFALLFCSPAAAGIGTGAGVGGGATPNEQPNLTLDQRSTSINLYSSPALQSPVYLLAQVEDEDPFGLPEDDEELYGFKLRSTRKAFIYSLLVPGAGQIYNKSTIIKPILFLGLEALGIMAHFNYNDKGVQRRDEYEAYADEYWSYDAYLNSLDGRHPNIPGDWRYGDTAHYYVDDQSGYSQFPHHLDVWIDPATDSAQVIKNHAYYENIGKYQQYQFGWDETEFDLDSISSFHTNYLGQREQANSAFKSASTALILTMANHLLAAFDAALSARRYNRQRDPLSQLSVKMRYALKEGRPSPRVIMTYRY